MPSEDLSEKSGGLADISTNDNQPTFLVLTARTRRGPHLRPVLVIGIRDGEIAIPREPAEWIRYILQYQLDAPAKEMLSTIGRLYVYSPTHNEFLSRHIHRKLLRRLCTSINAFLSNRVRAELCREVARTLTCGRGDLALEQCAKAPCLSGDWPTQHLAFDPTSARIA
jgi:hypothetical protein